MIKFIPFKIKSFNETSCWHWTKLHKYNNQLKFLIRSQIHDKPPLPVIVTLTRVGIKNLDSDNLMIAFKIVRDSICQLYYLNSRPGQHDSDPEFIWKYDQMKAKNKNSCGFVVDIHTKIEK